MKGYERQNVCHASAGAAITGKVGISQIACQRFRSQTAPGSPHRFLVRLAVGLLLAILLVLQPAVIPAHAQGSPGTVWAWGDNSHGQFGTGNRNSSSIPVITDAYFQTAISGGGQHSLILNANGRVLPAGGN